MPAIKNATEQYETTTTADSVERNASPAEIADMYRSYTADFFPGLRNDCIKTAVCMYTCAPDSRFVIDRLPGEDERHRRLALLRPRLQAFRRHRRSDRDARARRAQRGAGAVYVAAS